MPKKKGHVVTIEVTSSENLKSVGSQSETESRTIDQSKQLDQVQQFMEIRKAGASIKKSMIPKVYDHDAYQTRMISVVDYEKGRLNIAVMEPKEQKKVTNISIDLNVVHPLDKFDLHRKTAEMINKDAMIANLGIKKLQAINDKLKTQLKNEKLATRTRQIRVEELEQWIIELGANPKDEASIQALIKTKDKEIQVLKKSLKSQELTMYRPQNYRQSRKKKINL
jgi:hypothetical protein